MKYAIAFSALLLTSACLASGCGSSDRKDDKFFTSGNREADQRAEQRIAKDQQNKGEGEGTTKSQADQAKAKSLYERLGGDKGIRAIVDDFVPRAIADPRVNWERKGVKRGGFSLKRNQTVEWKAEEGKINGLKYHMVQFLSVATGGPTKYEGREMKEVHAGLNISNAEFDASIGDMKATLDKLQVPTDQQKELLAVLESARPEVVEER